MTDELKALAESLDAWADLVEQGYEVPAAAPIMRRAATALAALRETHHLIPKDQEPDATGRIMLQMAEASDRDAMWGRRWQALIRMYPREHPCFVDSNGDWCLRDALEYFGEACGYAPEKRYD